MMIQKTFHLNNTGRRQNTLNKEEISNYKGTVYLCTDCFQHFTDKEAKSFNGGFTVSCPYCKSYKNKIIHTANPSDMSYLASLNKFSY